MRFNLRRLLVAAGILCAAASAPAQGWPARPVTLVVGTPAGGAVDVYARALAEQLGKQTGGTFIVENKPGANGNISAEAVLNAPADGHTLWMGTQSMMTINPAAFPHMRWKPADFKPLVKGVAAPLVLVTSSAVPAKTFAELTAWIARQDHKAAYASFSPGTPSHFLGYQLGEKLKADLVHVPYKGSAPQVTALVAGQVPMGFTQLATSMPHIQSGKLHAIAVTGGSRSHSLPQVPTMAELGFPDLTTTIWFGLFAPAATPPAVQQAIMAAAIKVQANPDYRARMEAQNFDVPTESGAAFERAIAEETTRWARLVKATGFTAGN